ncbi:PDR/VanB family oxidoreductase [Paraburkholderia fungorum]|uniref:PDR/VanB family oxidoreductase n=1 Tax=Paraburkholderia fungorum TaxID=134537 RepID=UPI0038B74BCA
MVQVEPPRNHFRLDPGAASYRFIAGGIGVTPIMSMIRWCEANQKPWHLTYAARNRQRMAFYEELGRFQEECVRLHFDDEHGGPLDIPAALADVPAGEHIYCCGPDPLMKAVQAAASHIPVERVHFEWFTPPEKEEIRDDAEGFWIDLKQSGTSLYVAPSNTILEVLEENGHSVPFSCREGLCGTCEMTVCEGQPDHRDFVFSEAEHAGRRSVMVCVSRSKSPRLQLDL